MEQTRNGQPRIVITGMGALTPLGDLTSYWEGLVSGHSGVRRITHFDSEALGVKIAAEVDFEPRDHLNPKEARRMARDSQLALVAARMALEDAGLTQDEVAENGDRVGVVIGTVIAGFSLLVETAYDYMYKGRKPFPMELVNGLPNMPGHYISVEMGATGALSTISTACASGTQSIGAAMELIRSGRADIVFTGGVDCLIRKEVLAAFDAMTVLANKSNEEPTLASRPFDADRDGFVMGEGAGIIVLETLAHAQARGARIYAQALGHAASSDANHAAAPDSQGLGAQKAMRWAIQDAGLSTDQIGYINAHGTGTKVNDAIETFAIKQLFGERAYQIPVNSTKSMIGHCMGGSGALEAIACIKALHEGILHPTINYTTPDPECDLDYVPNQARQLPIRTALSNSFGLGGQNACLVFGTAP